jgi:hypothetical protein
MIPTCAKLTDIASLRRGDSGHAVWALQINLNTWSSSEALEPALSEDGLFGGRTDRRVRTFQRRNGLTIDGVAGPLTQRKLAIVLLHRLVQETWGVTVTQILHGLVELESAYIVGATNCVTPGGIDCGWLQIRVTGAQGDDPKYHNAFAAASAFTDRAEIIRERFDRYSKMNQLGNEYNWQNAALAHHWPAAAEQRARGIKAFNEWRYTADGTTYGVDDPAEWIVKYQIPGVKTARQLVEFYIGKTTQYVTQYGS